MLLTLVILALAATVTAAVCRDSLARAAESVHAQEELQRRWGILACERTFLPNAQSILGRAEQMQGRPLVSWSTRIMLNDDAYDLVFGTESAKIEVNQLIQQQGKAQAEAAIKKLLRQSGSDVPVHLLAGRPHKARRLQSARPAQGGQGLSAGQNLTAGVAVSTLAKSFEADEDDAHPIQSFGQVFPDVDPAWLVGTASRLGAAAAVTCWGDGTLDFHRASDAALRQFCPPTLTSAQTNRLIHLRQQTPGASVDDVLPALNLSEEVNDQIANRFTTQGDCHSLWVVVTTPRRSWYHLAILDRSGTAADPVHFAW